MRRGRLVPVGPELDYCRVYHCAGDCGRPHSQSERAAYAANVLDTFDAFAADDRREKVDTKQIVRKKAKDRL